MPSIELDRRRKRSYAKQIYNSLRESILAGARREGEVLPSTRVLAAELQVARNTVLTAYDMLKAEGFVRSAGGSGFYVSAGIFGEKPPAGLQDYSAASLADMRVEGDVLSFDSGMPALDLFPRAKWSRMVSRVFAEAPISALGYDDPQGRPEFRAVLRDYLKNTRGIACDPKQILITSGTKQGLTLVAKCLLECESEVWIEDPGNDNVRRIFSYHTERIVPFEVDAQGIDPAAFPLTGAPLVIFVTPARQFPMGGRLSLQRRIALLEFAREKGCYLVEDDYDSEFCYDGVSPRSLFELDRERVLHLGTFSKVLFPSLRLGYLVAPSELIPKLRELKRLSDHHSNSINQLALLHFLESGELQRHLRRMKQVYRTRRDCLCRLLAAYFPTQVKVWGAQSGMHVVAQFQDAVFTPELMEELLAAGVYMVPIEKHAIVKGNHENQLILGYAQLKEEEMARGLEILKEKLYPRRKTPG